MADTLSMGNRGRLTLAGSIALVLVVAALLVPTAGAARRHPLARTVKTTNLGSGVTYYRVTETNPNLKYYVVKVDPTAAATVDPATAGSTFGRYATTSTIAKNHNALVAINGDFTDNGMPVHPFAHDGEVDGTGLNQGSSLAYTRSEVDLHLNDARIHIKALNSDNGQVFDIGRFNQGRPGSGEIAGYSSIGGSVQKPPSSNVCSARLQPNGGTKWAANQDGVSRTYSVQTMSCSGGLSVNGGVVLAANKGGFTETTIRDLNPGTDVTLTWQPEDWKGVTDVIGGAPLLLRNGNIVATDTCDSYFCDRNPRSGVGITGGGMVLLITVDGRDSSAIGVTPVQFAKIFQDYGAKYAVNLDGGGGATMYIKGKGVVNMPSDGSERPVTNALLVLSGNDPGTPGGLSPTRMRPLATGAEAQDAQVAAEQDPASTGGLLDAFGGA